MNIVISGASKGLGKAFALQFAATGNTLFLCARNMQQLNETAAAIKQQFPLCTIHAKAVDMSNKKEVTEFGNWCLQLGIPDVLINNAGQFVPGSIHNEQDGVLEKLMAINLYSAYQLTRLFLPAMMDQSTATGAGRHVFNICSIASLQAYTIGSSYSISKFALLGFSKNLREEMKPYNIKVTSVIPGATFTDSWAGSGVDEKRIMQADDVAKMVYAASKLSPQACLEEILLRPQLGDL
ncbi:MAG: SDR family NAD(P)-dependent oxidoreductase [Chitinophagaceae bacterium]|nr:SDR family NAD(P)-dependent oxidoreductase [Chitinophagaceae bacterium]